MCFAFNIMHDWRAVTKTVHLAPRYQGHSLSVQCYEFYLHAILFLLLIHTRPPISSSLAKSTGVAFITLVKTKQKKINILDRMCRKNSDPIHVIFSPSLWLKCAFKALPYRASLGTWNWLVAGKHLYASHPRSSVWPNPRVSLFSGNFFWKHETVISPQPLKLLN